MLCFVCSRSQIPTSTRMAAITTPISHQMLWTNVRKAKTMVRTTISQKTLVRAFSIMRVLPLRAVGSDSGIVGAVDLVPVDAGGIRVVDDRGAAAVGERVPCPVDERVDPGAGRVEQPGVHPEPGGEGDRPVQLVVVLAHLGDRGTMPDHRHDPLVVVLERRGGLAVDHGEDAVGDRPTCLEGDGSELGIRRPVRIDTGCSVADGVEPRASLDAEVAADADPTTHIGECLETADLAGLEPAGPDDTAGQDVRAVGEHRAVGFDRGDRCAELEDDVLLGERLGRVHVRLVGERGEDDVAVVDERDRRRADVEVVISLRHHLVDQVGERTGRLDAGGSRADDDEVQRSLLETPGLEVGVLEQAQHPVAEVLGVER